MPDTMTTSTLPVMEIRHRWTGNILFSLESDSFRLAVEVAVHSDANLRGANLRGADLGGADLRGADLRGANLRGADLGGAYLRGADLGGAYLRGADLGGANLRDANLGGADLRGADLGGAYLRGADLGGANLRDADLRGADLGDAYLRGADLGGAYLRGADLGGANLRDANLRGADLGDAYLRGADLGGANLLPIRDDLWSVLAGAPAEVEGLRQAIIEGRIDGSTYSGECACLITTLAKVRGCDYQQLPFVKPNSSRLIERWFTNISPGDTPEKSPITKLTLEWVDTFLANMRAVFGPHEGA